MKPNSDMISLVTKPADFAKELLSHNIGSIIAEHADAGDKPVDLAASTVPQLDELRGCKVLPPEPIQRYLESDDVLTNDIIDSMELAMEKAAMLPKPFFITSMRSGQSGKDLALHYFYLDKEEEG